MQILKRRIFFLMLFFFSEACIISSYSQTQCLTPTPPMGWNAWNCFGGDINEERIRNVALAMVTSGMKDAGFQYIVIDDVWFKGRLKGGYFNYPADVPGRDENGRLIPDPVKFPNGIKALSDYVHSLGLKFGIYTSPGRATCTNCPASGGHEETDVQTFADWGVDFIKLDWCGATTELQPTLTKWRTLLDQCGRPMVLSINAARGDDYSFHKTLANMWRTTTDITKVWAFPPELNRMNASMLEIIHQQIGLEEYHGNCGWNDPDMMQVGNKPFTFQENKTHFSMWAIFGAPLIAGNDLRNMTDSTIMILTNKEVIAIDQDQAGIRGIKINDYKPGLEIWVKRLQKIGEQAVILLNTTEKEAEIKINWKDIGIKQSAFVRDLWEHKDKGEFSESYSALVPPHGVTMLKVTANEYLGTLPDMSIKKEEFLGNGKIFECESEICHFESANFDKQIKGFSGTGYLVGKNQKWDWAHLIIVWRVTVQEEGEFDATIRYNNASSKEYLYTINKADGPDLKILPTQMNHWNTINSKVKLKKGINWITFESKDCQMNDIAVDNLKLKLIKD